jgi:hypothetical protein
LFKDITGRNALTLSGHVLETFLEVDTNLLVKYITGRNALTLSGHELETFLEVDTNLLVKDITGRNELNLSGHELETFLEVDESVEFAYFSYLFQKYPRTLFYFSKFHIIQRTEELWLEAADCCCSVS